MHKKNNTILESNKNAISMDAPACKMYKMIILPNFHTTATQM